MKRREFIQLSALCSLALLSPVDIIAKAHTKKSLILVELDGGNDGLNTVVPYKEKNYYNLRNNLALKKEELFVLDEKFGLNKQLKNLHEIYKHNSCAVVNGLGYDKPNKSHFRSIEIVETASDSNEVLNEGWIAQELKRFSISENRPANALLIGKRKQGHLFSKEIDILQLKSIEDFIKKSSKVNPFVHTESSNLALAHIFKQNRAIVQANNAFKTMKNVSLTQKYHQSEIAQDFKEAAKIVLSNLDIPVIKLSQKGYDTHSNQVERHGELLHDLDEAIGSFVKEMKVANVFDDVLIMTYSEFGRRVKENGSLGTDHGEASCQFVIGGKVKGGIYGQYPSLKHMHKNNLIYTTHYRSLYNTILNGWFGRKDNKFNSYDIINFL